MGRQPSLVLGPADAQAAVRKRDALGSPVLGPPFVERAAADAEVGADFGDGELVALLSAMGVVSGDLGDDSQRWCQAGRPVRDAEMTSAAVCPLCAPSGSRLCGNTGFLAFALVLRRVPAPARAFAAGRLRPSTQEWARGYGCQVLITAAWRAICG